MPVPILGLGVLALGLGAAYVASQGPAGGSDWDANMPQDMRVELAGRLRDSRQPGECRWLAAGLRQSNYPKAAAMFDRRALYLEQHPELQGTPPAPYQPGTYNPAGQPMPSPAGYPQVPPGAPPGTIPAGYNVPPPMPNPPQGQPQGQPPSGWPGGTPPPIPPMPGGVPPMPGTPGTPGGGVPPFPGMPPGWTPPPGTVIPGVWPPPGMPGQGPPGGFPTGQPGTIDPATLGHPKGSWTKPNSEVAYVVQPGDFGWGIPVKYGRDKSEVKELVAINPQIADWQKVMPGTDLNIPQQWWSGVRTPTKRPGPAAPKGSSLAEAAQKQGTKKPTLAEAARKKPGKRPGKGAVRA